MWHEIFEAMDKSGDGKIDPTELQALLESVAGVGKVTSMRNAVEMRMSFRNNPEDPEELTHGKRMTEEEISARARRRWHRGMRGAMKRVEQVKRILKHLDSNEGAAQDGEIDFEEVRILWVCCNPVTNSLGGPVLT